MEIIFHPEVKEDIEELDGSVRKRFKKTLKKIKRAPRLGKPLGNKGEIDLSSCLKMYFNSKKYRVVYEILDNNKIIIWSVGKREAEVVYFNAYKRILKEGKEE
ncbi:type II toxin-antitoxin system RelE family toxin [Halanaerobacter jeridensis]|uniref:mRNA interferase RelE/StbE n=1 Tax=Halanaerobacter jeridensis TaxID=706427 RepID=A0A938XPG2_9FIRM|nr:type II toxin-antitoxin system RelE/ParE family toxin [Halanaerobacter jeridensis]MBM7556542.1 mRNA interferase RelE/StbE [Halanaerobacter jeridensis]